MNYLEHYKPDFQEFGERPDIDVVYHGTTYDRLSGIENGLHPFHEIDDPTGIDDLLDNTRPNFIKNLGISRKDAVYAHAHLDVIDWLNKKRATGVGEEPKHRVGIGIAVDPEETYVFDAFHLEFLAYSIDKALLRGDSPANVESVTNHARKYWNSAVRLDEFRRLYKAQFDEKGAGYERSDNEALYYQWVMIYPEVLVMGTVEPSRLQWILSESKIN